jgi:hypothetical protein
VVQELLYADLEKELVRISDSEQCLDLAKIERLRSCDGIQRTIWDSSGWQRDVCEDKLLNAAGTKGLVCAVAGDGLAAHQTKSNLSFHSTYLLAMSFFK